MPKNAIKIGAQCRIEHSNSRFDGQTGIVRKATLDHKGHPAAVQVEVDGEPIWFGASAVHPVEEQTV